MATFSDLVKEHGSVSAALKAQGYSKGSNGSWTKSSGSSSGNSGAASKGSSGSSSGGSGSAKGSSGYYDPNLDYSLAIKNAQSSGASQSYISQLQQERQNKIDAIYGGSDPYKGSSDIMGSGSSGGNGGSSYGNYGGVSQNIDYQALIDQAVAKGDYTSAAIYEQMRNQKISSPDYKGSQTTTDYYSQYLPGKPADAPV